MNKITFCCLLMVAASRSMAQDNPLYEKKEFISGKDTLLYRILYPLDYQPKKKYPCILVLHGAGERGKDNIAQLKWGSYLFADSNNRLKFPAIVIFPQCPTNNAWGRISRDGNNSKDSLGGLRYMSNIAVGRPLEMVMQLLDSMVSSKIINKQQVYVGGLSMGGMGTFEILWRKPSFFAAAFPICGGGDPAKVSTYARKFPIWVFHGDKDAAVPVGNSRLMVGALKAGGAKVKYSEYPGVGHDSWNNAFAEPDLLPWMFKQKRK